MENPIGCSIGKRADSRSVRVSHGKSIKASPMMMGTSIIHMLLINVSWRVYVYMYCRQRILCFSFSRTRASKPP